MCCKYNKALLAKRYVTVIIIINSPSLAAAAAAAAAADIVNRSNERYLTRPHLCLTYDCWRAHSLDRIPIASADVN